MLLALLVVGLIVGVVGLFVLNLLLARKRDEDIAKQAAAHAISDALKRLR